MTTPSHEPIGWLTLDQPLKIKIYNQSQKVMEIWYCTQVLFANKRGGASSCYISPICLSLSNKKGIQIASHQASDWKGKYQLANILYIYRTYLAIL